MPAEAPLLDTLLLNYLNTLDTYQSQIKQISQGLSDGFLNLATANFHAPSGRWYGKDWYDKRMKAIKEVEVVAAATGDIKDQIEFRIHKIKEEEEEEEKEDRTDKAEPTATLRQRKKQSEEVHLPVDAKADQKPGDEQQTFPLPLPPSPPTAPVKKQVRDPLKWFGILSPPALRYAQTSFESTLPILCQLATTLNTLRTMSLDLYIYKLLPSKPAQPLPDVLPLSRLDQDSGYVHLCSASQAKGVVERYMGGAEEVWVLRIPLAKVQESLKWEKVSDMEGELFPHYFGDLMKAHVSGTGRWVDGAGVESIVWEDL